jgi:hypothetical protein
MQSTIKRALVLMSLLGLAGTAGLLITFNAMPGHAQEPNGKGYLPHLSNLMNEAMQVHHIKLWLAGHASNWELAAYEVKKIRETIVEVKEAIVDIQNASPQWHRVPVGEMLQSVDSNLDSLDQAIKAKNGAKFAAAYQGLTAACDACHTRAGEPQIKIIEPLPNGSGAFSDQDFAAGNSPQ